MTPAETTFRVALSCLLATGVAPAAEPVERQPIDEAWFTGPMLAPSAGALPRGLRVIPRTRSVPVSVTPAVALDMVF